MKTFIKTNVLDAGGRYGLHPTWKNFSGELNYFLFEPDPQEATRLYNKYRKRSHEITVIDKALTEHSGSIKINIFNNRAMSSSATRNPISATYQGERKSEVDVIETLEVAAISIDNFCQDNDIKLDFLKLDTEGTEFSILKGSTKQLTTSILAVRSEVAFDYIFQGMPLFNEIHDFMLDKGFCLLNLDYKGKGDNQNEYVNSNDNYGILTSTDAVWIKRPEEVLKINEENSLYIIKLLKFCAFLMLNNAPDVAIDILLKARNFNFFTYDQVRDTYLFKFLYISISKHFYSLKWQPGQSLKNHSETFYRIFNLHMLQAHEFMESLELNPD